MGNVYFPGYFETVNKIPNGIYSLVFNHKEYRPEVIWSESSFSLPKKLYGLDDIFINRVLSTFKEKPQNLGILLTGYKGTGKTVLCKYICNQLNLPIIRLPRRLGSDHFNLFLNSINQDFVLFVDEYEKKFKDEKEELLDVMDGAFSTKHKILFLLTTNEMTISEYLMNRPNRVYYIKKFLDLDEETIDLVTDDLLIDKSQETAVKEILPIFQHITIDNLIALINEMNRYKCVPKEALNYMNIPLKETKSKFGIIR